MLKVSSSSACVLKHVQSNVRTSSWNLRNTSSTSINTRRITNISASLRPRYLSQHSRLNVHLNSLPSLTMTELNSLGLQFSSGTTDSNESNNDTLKDEDSTKSEEEKHTSSTKEEWSKASGLADILRPKQVVEELEKNIIGQAQAKKAVAIAIRNRWRRQQLEGDMRAEVTPKNILMVGPTGSGKTEIARRVAKLGDAPFVKVEATKFTEVGFHGKDVDTIIHDLVQASIRLTIEKRSARHAKLIKEKVDERILQSILGADAEENTLKTFRSKIQQGLLEDREVTIELPPETDGSPKMLLVVSGVHHSIGGMNKQNGGDRTEKKTLTVKEAREILERIEKDKLMNNDDILTEAVAAVENSGIVFIDEIDKIAVNKELTKSGADASSEGVQRDLLPLIEGSAIDVKIQDKTLRVNTEHILFICAGAFSQSKPTDLLAEFLGRLPIRVQLQALTADDFYKILTETKITLPSQHKALLKTEGVNLQFTDESLHEIARYTALGNKIIENIGARRLHTVIEKVVDDISYNASEEEPGTMILVDAKLVKEKVGVALEEQSDFSRFIM